MSKLWIPPGAVLPDQLPRAGVPTGDMRLADGRILKDHGLSTVRAGGQSLTLRVWLGRDGLKVLASMDTIPDRAWGPLLHVSLSYPHHDPSWADISLVRAAFFGPQVDVAMILPRPQHYVNLHKHTFHLWQTPEAWGIM